MFDEFPEPARSQLAAAFAEGRTRPQWCFAEGRARLAFWAPFAGADPVIVWQFEPGPDSAAAAALLRRGLRETGLGKIMHDISLPPGLTPVVDRAVEHEALTGAGFVMEVERLTLAWTAGADVASSPGPTWATRLPRTPSCVPDTRRSAGCSATTGGLRETWCDVRPGSAA
ncbi:hypothetical protein ACIBQ6_25370 [Nonomuraea sp. NPDC049655]|uniref:hypothetical protein n=1 Tax=Nonomuraea sp. NPDC049655 TaxID=3364355 RepID=UPI00378F0564